jgi:hypothetical protein
MLILNMSGKCNGLNTIFIGSDAFYYEGKVLANGNTLLLVRSNGNCTINGDAEDVDVMGNDNTFGDGPG